jgi:hypothetical protein
MKSYTFGFEAKADAIQYAEIEYDSFIAREVLRDKKPIGTYHIKIKDDSSLTNVVNFFKKQLPDCEVGLIDPDNFLNLEYPIFILIKSKMVLDTIINIFKEIDKDLKS